jgi:molybdopterin molybdotransferase
MTVLRQIATEDCCCDGRAAVKKLIPVDEAVACISRTVRPVDRVEVIGLETAAGRVLAETGFASAPVPPFDNSAMDGYAVRSQDFVGEGPWRLPIAGSVVAGHGYGTCLRPASVMQVLTGAPIPDGADTVVPQEYVTVADGSAVFSSRPKTGNHVRYRGEDLQKGQPVIHGGSRLGSPEVAVLAASGHRKVAVRGRVRVAVLATGDELRESGDVLGEAAIWDVNTPLLRSALQSAGAELVETISVVDHRQTMTEEFLRLAAVADLIITTGGVSVGDRDFVKPALMDAGGQMLFAGVAMKPGKPVSFGRIGRAWWLGLPGNPYAALVAWTLFGTPLLDVLSGLSEPRRAAVPAITATRLAHPVGRSEFRLAHLDGFDGQGRMVVNSAGATHSARVSGLAAANGIVEIPGDIEEVPAGSLVRFVSF